MIVQVVHVVTLWNGRVHVCLQLCWAAALGNRVAEYAPAQSGMCQLWLSVTVSEDKLTSVGELLPIPVSEQSEEEMPFYGCDWAFSEGQGCRTWDPVLVTEKKKREMTRSKCSVKP